MLTWITAREARELSDIDGPLRGEIKAPPPEDGFDTQPYGSQSVVENLMRCGFISSDLFGPITQRNSPAST